MMDEELNLRSYGLLIREGKILVAEEIVCEKSIFKYPGGGVEPRETPENGLIREFLEETQMEISVIRLLYTPGTLFSPWIQRRYTPLYYEVQGSEEPNVPKNEKIKLHFMDPKELLCSHKVASPELVALNYALGKDH
tara:strand:- start:77 stop:487 length:411 start_codon:yes stop_codon:yes gene_type:complete